MTPNRTRPAFAPWDERVSPRIISPEDAARSLRTFAVVAEQSSKMLEAFSTVVEAAHARATLARHARHQVWHATIFRDSLGDSSGDAGEIDDPGLRSFLDAVAAPADANSSVEFLSGVYRVLVPRKITAYTYFVRALGGDANDADARWFDFILKDEFDSLRDGELLLQSMLTAPDAVQRSAQRRAELEAQIVKLGGIAGPGSLGGSGAPTAPKETTQ